jgi:Fe-coproporphyrin III synthase
MRMPLRLWPPSRAARLRLLVLAVSDRCDQTCAHCDIWRGEGGGRTLTREERLRVVEEALAAGVEEALLTGGEPLLSADLWPIAERLRAHGVRLSLASNGMLLERYATEVGALFHEVYVSLDGASPATHDGLRGVPALERLGAGVAALQLAAPAVLRVARTTLHGGNLAELAAIVALARRLRFDHVSFLPLDAASAAFGGHPERRAALVPGAEAVEAFRRAVDALEAEGALADGFVLESADKLRRLGRHLDASAGRAAFERPACDAPWWSSVVEADGRLRPCFFHEPVGDARQGLRATRGSPAYGAALARIRRANATCDRCVCPKRRGVGLREAWDA